MAYIFLETNKKDKILSAHQINFDPLRTFRSKTQPDYNSGMTIFLDRGLRHMAWANQKVFGAIEGLSPEALGSYIVNQEWSAYQIASHICKSSGFYCFRLGLSERPADLNEPVAISELKRMLSERDRILVGAAKLEDKELEFNRGGVIIKRWTSTIVTQAIHHATEHRAQLIDALESRGVTPINLDDIDLWAFDEFERNI